MEEGRIGFQDSSGDLTVHHYVTEGRHRSVWEFHHWVAHQGLGCWAGLVTRCSCLSSEIAPGSVKPMCSHGSINECHNYTVIRGKLLEQKCKYSTSTLQCYHLMLQHKFSYLASSGIFLHRADYHFCDVSCYSNKAHWTKKFQRHQKGECLYIYPSLCFDNHNPYVVCAWFYTAHLTDWRTYSCDHWIFVSWITLSIFSVCTQNITYCLSFEVQ